MIDELVVGSYKSPSHWPAGSAMLKLFAPNVSPAKENHEVQTNPNCGRDHEMDGMAIALKAAF